MQVSHSKSCEKSDSLSHRVRCSPAEVTCMVVVTTRIYFSQSKINSFNLFQGPYLQNRDFWESILWSQRPSQSLQIQKHPKCSGVAGGGVQ